jgi:hypothetical protein
MHNGYMCLIALLPIRENKTMKLRMTLAGTLLALALSSVAGWAQELPEGYWSLEHAKEVQDKTRVVVLDPDLSTLTAAERSAVAKLLEAGGLFNRIYQDSLHPQALTSLETLRNLEGDPKRIDALLDIFYRSQGPITTTFDNERVPFLPVIPEQPGKNVYPTGLTVDMLDGYLGRHPGLKADMLDLRTVVRASSEQNLHRDLETLDRFPVLDTLHPGLRQRLESLRASGQESGWYALPYSVRWAPDIMKAYQLILGAANDMQDEDPDFSAYLSLRARDLLSDNYEAGDAAWVRGRFHHLNAQIGSYEVYPDSLYGVKSFFSMSLLVRDVDKSRELSAALGSLQDIQERLPVASERKIQSDIAVGVYNIIADFGQSRSANTATILPNDADHTRKYGRTILLRYNIMTDPGLFEDRKVAFQTAVEPEFADDLTIDGPFYFTLWHEVGHYLGVDKTVDGGDLNDALSPWGSHYEEMKADLVSAFTSAQLNASGEMNDATYRSVQAASVLRTLQKNKPRIAEQPYQAMQLMQMNYFLEHGLLGFDTATARLVIDYARYNDVIRQMLGDVLDIQLSGDAQRAAGFIDKYTTWTPELHETLARRLRDASRYRFVTIRYKALAADN